MGLQLWCPFVDCEETIWFYLGYLLKPKVLTLHLFPIYLISQKRTLKWPLDFLEEEKLSNTSLASSSFFCQT